MSRLDQLLSKELRRGRDDVELDELARLLDAYWKGKTRADIFVAFKSSASVAVELKRDLQDRGEYHRLVGQVYEYLTEWEVEVLVVLCGDNDPALVKNVEQFVKFMNNNVQPKVRFLLVACTPPTKLAATPHSPHESQTA